MMTEEEAELFMQRVARRFAQCLTCRNDPSTCGGTDANENERGMCMRYSLIDLNKRATARTKGDVMKQYGIIYMSGVAPDEEADEAFNEYIRATVEQYDKVFDEMMKEGEE